MVLVYTGGRRCFCSMGIIVLLESAARCLTLNGGHHGSCNDIPDVKGAVKVIKWKMQLFERCLLKPSWSGKYFHSCSEKSLNERVFVFRHDFPDVSHEVVRANCVLFVRVVPKVISFLCCVRVKRIYPECSCLGLRETMHFLVCLLL